MQPNPTFSDSQGLNSEQVSKLQKEFGKNDLPTARGNRLVHVVLNVVREPMFLLLVFASLIYLVLGRIGEGWMMMVGIIFISAISVYQERRSAIALSSLVKYTEPGIKVIRDGLEQTVPVIDLVPGDIIILEEGNQIPADAVVVDSNDLFVNEAAITGESLPAQKNKDQGNNIIYQGTTITSGRAYAAIKATGAATVFGKIARSVSGSAQSLTALQIQMRSFVKWLTYFGVSGFVCIWLINYLKTGMFAESLLIGLTLAVAAIPEEIPVAFTTFLALGAFRLARIGIITREPQTIENLGAVSVVCLDKTGTITENKMSVKSIYVFGQDLETEMKVALTPDALRVLYLSMLASEAQPFDAMEKAIHEAFEQCEPALDYGRPELIFEYPLKGSPPMMSHVYRLESGNLIAAKGATEKILEVCDLDESSIAAINVILKNYTLKGYRVLAIASAKYIGTQMPANQEEFAFHFEGLLALFDPPRKNVASVFSEIYRSGIKIKLLSGDHPGTVLNIASQVGFITSGSHLTGEQVMQLELHELRAQVLSTDIFARMFPEAKKKVIDALRAEGEVVCMIGDGVNDAPALRNADIGIAMGNKGTDIAKGASDLVLTDDNLERLPEAIRQGRRIYTNLKKAFRYIISIHIPIILVTSIPLILGWKYPNIFTLVHVLFLELIMGPTCSVFFEREPIEESVINGPPEKRTLHLFTVNEILVSLVQGISIACGVLILFYLYMRNNHSLEKTRAVVFVALVLCNIVLTFSNRSFRESLLKTSRYKNILALWVLLLSLALLIITQAVPYVRQIFGFDILQPLDILVCMTVGIASVIWFEGYKWVLRLRSNAMR